MSEDSIDATEKLRQELIGELKREVEEHNALAVQVEQAQQDLLVRKGSIGRLQQTIAKLPVPPAPGSENGHREDATEAEVVQAVEAAAASATPPEAVEVDDDNHT